LKSGQVVNLSRLVNKHSAHCLNQDEDDITLDSVLLISSEEIKKSRWQPSHSLNDSQPIMPVRRKFLS
jgi:hypothetical protein